MHLEIFFEIIDESSMIYRFSENLSMIIGRRSTMKMDYNR